VLTALRPTKPLKNQTEMSGKRAKPTLNKSQLMSFLKLMS